MHTKSEVGIVANICVVEFSKSPSVMPVVAAVQIHNIETISVTEEMIHLYKTM